MPLQKVSIVAEAMQAVVFSAMKNTKPGITTILLVLIPPLLAGTAYLAPFRDGFQDFISNILYISSASILWCPFSLLLKRRTFIAGLLGMHAMMSWFLFSMWMHWGDDLGWILYFPDLLIGCLGGVLLSSIARKADECIHRIPKLAWKRRF